MQRTSSNISTYIPMARQKNAAADAISLLSQMAIPQIEVDPISQAVKTASGQGVSIFIDFLPVTAQDLQGQRRRETCRVGRRPPRTPNRRHRCIRYSLHRLREIPVPRLLLPLNVRRFMKIKQGCAQILLTLDIIFAPDNQSFKKNA